MKSDSIPTLLLLASTCLPPSALAATIPRSTPPSYEPDSISWQSCGSGIPKTVECAYVSVPLDWSKPNGEKIKIAVNRLQATDKSSTDNLVINPGGPGGSGTSAVLEIATGAYGSAKLKKKYNLIGVDPRGIGLSTPVKCDTNLWNERHSLFPTTESEYNDLVSWNKAVGQSCLKLTGDLVKHLDTTSVARDFEAVRQALGDKKLNLLGLSYGTQIGAQYAELFPKTVGKFVLDGNVDHSGASLYGMTTEVATYEHELERFATWCSSSDLCALKSEDVLAVYDALVKNATAKPISAPGCDGVLCREDVNGEELRTNTQGLLILKPTTWEVLGLALAQAAKGNATLLSTTLAVKGETEANTALFGYKAVGCLDWFPASSLSSLEYQQQLTKSIAPHTGGASQGYGYQAGCIGWPAPVVNPPHKVKVDGAPPILLVNSLYDPETSYTWAVGLQQQIPGSVLLTRDGDGHTSYVLGGEASKVVDSFLVDGVLPKKDMVVDS